MPGWAWFLAGMPAGAALLIAATWAWVWLYGRTR